MKSWAESWDNADRTCGADLPSVHSLPHMGERAAKFAASVTGPNGELTKIEPSFIGRILSVFKRTNEEEIETLRRLIREVGA